MKFWQSLSFTETDQLVALSKICEEVGFHGALVSDHVFFPEKIDSKYPYSEDGSPPFTAETEWPEPWAAIAAMSTATTRLRFCTAVYLAPLRHPLLVAKAVGTAALLSGGRVALGVGAGWIEEEFRQLGQDFRTRGRRLDEMIEVLKKVWAGGMVEHHGEFTDFDRLQMSPAPREPIPIYVGGASPGALRRAARNDQLEPLKRKTKAEPVPGASASTWPGAPIRAVSASIAIAWPNTSSPAPSEASNFWVSTHPDPGTP